MISLMINSLYNFVDSIFVSRISEDALTALSLSAQVQLLMSAMGLGIAVGLNAVISKALSEQDKEKVRKTASAALALAFLAWVLLLFDASEEMLVIGAAAIRIMAVSYLLSNICLTYSAAFQGLGMGIQSMLLTLARQVVLPVIFVAMLSHTRNLPLIWMAFVFAETVVIPVGTFLWRKESGKVLKGMEQTENIRPEKGNINSSKSNSSQSFIG